MPPAAALEENASLCRENSRKSIMLSGTKEDASVMVRVCGSRWCRRTAALSLAVCQLLFGGLVVPVSCLAVLDSARDSARRQSASCNIINNLQFALIGQGVFLAVSGALVICWIRATYTSDAAPVDIESTPAVGHRRCSSSLLCVLVGLLYTATVASVCYIVWQMMDGSLYCDWSTLVYAVLIPTELVASLLSAISTGLISLESCHYWSYS